MSTRAWHDGAPPGLEAAWYLRAAAANLSETDRTALSAIVRGLRTRGWLPSRDALVEQCAAATGLQPQTLNASFGRLVDVGLLELGPDDKPTTVAGLLSAAPTGWTLHVGGERTHLLGPIAALVITSALACEGEIDGRCSHDATRVRLRGDTHGVAEHEPEALALFLPAWDTARSVAANVAAGAFFADEAGLAAWQDAHGEPDGMPINAMLFGFAARQLGEEIGPALRPLFDQVADFH